jgi:hypothetical protein
VNDKMEYHRQAFKAAVDARYIELKRSPQNPPRESEYFAPFWDMTFEEAVRLAERMNAEEN